MTPAWYRAWRSKLARVGGARRFPGCYSSGRRIKGWTPPPTPEYVRQFCLLNGLKP